MQFDQSIADKCAARDKCSAHGVLCSSICVGFMELDYQLRLSRIPERYWNIFGKPASSDTAAALIRGSNPNAAQYIKDYSQEINNNIANGDGLYLHGKQTGTGKTTSAAAIGCDYIRSSVSSAIQNSEPLRKASVLYVNVPNFLRTVKQIYEEDRTVSAEASSEVAWYTHKMRIVPLLVLDDIGAEKPSEAVRERLLDIIEQRQIYKSRSTIFTSNLTLAELEISLGSRIRSRIEGSTIPIPFGGIDHRRK